MNAALVAWVFLATCLGLEHPHLNPIRSHILPPSQGFKSLHAQFSPPTCPPFVHVIISGVDLSTVPHARAHEYVSTLQRNLDNPHVEALHVFWEGSHESWMHDLTIHQESKIVHAGIRHGRLKFEHAVKYMNDKLAGEVVILTNADIQLIAGLDCDNLNQHTLPNLTMLTPQRYEQECIWSGVAPLPSVQYCDCRRAFFWEEVPNCYDTYIMRSPLPAKLLDSRRLDMYVGGEWGTENLFIAEARHVGVTVYAPPCGLMFLAHRHCSQLRPNQFVRAKTQSHPDVCTAYFCLNTCQRPYLPYPDHITEICRDLDLCHTFERRLAVYQAKHGLAQNSGLVCTIEPHMILLEPEPLLLESWIRYMQQYVCKEIMIIFQTVPALVALLVVNGAVQRYDWAQRPMLFRTVMAALMIFISGLCLMSIQLGIMKILGHEYAVPTETTDISLLHFQQASKPSLLRSGLGCFAIWVLGLMLTSPWIQKWWWEWLLRRITRYQWVLVSSLQNIKWSRPKTIDEQV